MRERAGRTGEPGHITWGPVYRFIRKAGPYPVEEARELTQDFFAYFLEERRRIKHAGPGGRLKEALRRFLSQRGRRPDPGPKPGRLTLSLEGADPEIVIAVANLEHLAPDEAVELHWAEELLSKTA